MAVRKKAPRGERAQPGKRETLLHDIDEKKMMNTLDPHLVRCAEISRKAWGQATALKDAREELKKVQWTHLSFRKKQKAILEFTAGIIESMDYQMNYTKWCLENPGDAMRLFVSTIPKEIQATVTHEGNVVLLPAKMRSVNDWLSEVKSNPDGESIDVEPLDE